MKTLRKLILFLGVLIITTSTGGSFGFGYGVLQINGLLVPWSEITAPPETPVKIVMVDGDQLWVQTTGGKLFWNSSSSDCQINCWIQVDSFPDQPVDRGEYIHVTSEPCSPPPPTFSLVDQKAECESNGFYNLNRVYAIKSDGTMMLWKTETGGEWALVELAFFIGGGMLLSLLVGIPLAIIKGAKQ